MNLNVWKCFQWMCVCTRVQGKKIPTKGKKTENILKIFVIFGIYKQNHVIDCNQEYKDFICSLILYVKIHNTFDVSQPATE